MDRNEKKEPLYQLHQHVYFVTGRGVMDGDIAAIFQNNSGGYTYSVQVWLGGYIPIFLGNNFVPEKMVFGNEEKAYELWRSISISKAMIEKLKEKQ